MPKFNFLSFVFIFILSNNLFSQSKSDSTFFNYINLIRKGQKIQELKMDSSLNIISKEYAGFIMESFNNLEDKNLKKGMKRVFFETEDVYREMSIEHLGFSNENLIELHTFIASKDKTYSEEELCDLIMSLIVSDKHDIYDILCGEHKKIGISCICKKTFEFNQVVVCIISYE